MWLPLDIEIAALGLNICIFESQHVTKWMKSHNQNVSEVCCNNANVNVLCVLFKSSWDGWQLIKVYMIPPKILQRIGYVCFVVISLFSRRLNKRLPHWKSLSLIYNFYRSWVLDRVMILFVILPQTYVMWQDIVYCPNINMMFTLF